MPIARLRASLATLLLLLLLAPLAGVRGAAVRGQEGGAAPEDEKEWFRTEMAQFEPFERRLPQGSLLTLRFRLRGSCHSPVLAVVFPDGSASYFPPESKKGREYVLPFRLDRRAGRHRVALAVDTPGGTQYAARFFIAGLDAEGKEVDRDLELPAADTVYSSLDPEEDPLRIERILFHRMNGLRRKQGVAVLPWHEGVARSAREQMPDIARHWEETVRPRTGEGTLVHFLPGAGPGGTDGPSIADRVRLSLGWPLVVSRLPSGPPTRGRDRANYVSESLAKPTDSLDRKFEQDLIRKSDHRAALLNADLTHAAGAACWRYYGWKGEDGSGAAVDRTGPPGAAPRGVKREALTALVYIQVNDPKAEESLEKDRRMVRAALARASKLEERAEALRLLGQHALAEAPGLLETRAGDRDPEIAAGALDGLWLCDPERARGVSDSLEVRVVQAVVEEEEFRAAGALEVLSRVRYDAGSRRRAREFAEEIGKRGAAALAAAEGLVLKGDREGARAALEAAGKRFAGFAAGEEATAAVRAMGGEGGK